MDGRNTQASISMKIILAWNGEECEEGAGRCDKRWETQQPNHSDRIFWCWFMRNWWLAFWGGWSLHWLGRDILNMSATSVVCVQGAKKDGASAQVMSAPIMQVIMEIADWTEKKI